MSTVDLARTMLELAGAEVPRHLQGRQFLGEGRDDPREYVFAARDRQDVGYLTRRMARDDRFKYIRNWTPGPAPWFPYRNSHPVMDEIRERQREGRLVGAERWFDRPLPSEELYDLRADPHETENLADDPAHAEAMDRLRGALEDWRKRTGDLGETSEAELVASWWPDGDQPTTATPTFVPNAPGNPSREAAPDGGSFEAPTTVGLHCATQGASLAYATGTGADAAGETSGWTLYTGPIELDPGETRLRAKAIRYGYAESDAREATFVVRG